MENCRLCGLPDLNTEDPRVRKLLFEWILYDVVKKFDIDGIRIDTVRHINMEFWRELDH